MSGRFKPTVSFYIYDEDAKTARLQIEPFISVDGYGVLFRVLYEKTGKDKFNEIYSYEREMKATALMVSDIKVDDTMSEQFVNFIEGFFYNQIPNEQAISISALMLRVYLPKWIEEFDIELGDNYIEIEREERKMGLKH